MENIQQINCESVRISLACLMFDNFSSVIKQEEIRRSTACLKIRIMIADIYIYIYIYI